MDKEDKVDAWGDDKSISRSDLLQKGQKPRTLAYRRLRRRDNLSLSNLRLARSTWGLLTSGALKGLRTLTESHRFSVAAGDLQLLDGRWYVTHSGLLGLAQRRQCAGIETELLKDLSDASQSQWVFKAKVYKTPGSMSFAGYGDADPSNVSSMVRGAELRIAETRAVNRALRKAYGIGFCSFEELGALPATRHRGRRVCVASAGEDAPAAARQAPSAGRGARPRACGDPAQDQAGLRLTAPAMDEGGPLSPGSRHPFGPHGATAGTVPPVRGREAGPRCRS